MAERNFLSDTTEADVERSTEEIRHDITKGEEDISRTVEEIGERIKEKLDWRGYVKDSPYWAMGVAAGLGYLASGVFKTRTTPVERIMESIAEKAGPGLIKVTLLSVAARVVARWIRNATATGVASGAAGSRPQTGGDSSIHTKVDT